MNIFRIPLLSPRRAGYQRFLADATNSLCERIQATNHTIETHVQEIDVDQPYIITKERQLPRTCGHPLMITSDIGIIYNHRIVKHDIISIQADAQDGWLGSMRSNAFFWAMVVSATRTALVIGEELPDENLMPLVVLKDFGMADIFQSSCDIYRDSSLSEKDARKYFDVCVIQAYVMRLVANSFVCNREVTIEQLAQIARFTTRNNWRVFLPVKDLEIS